MTNLAKFTLVFIALSGFVWATGGETVDLLKTCKKECPEAKTQVQAFACTELLEHDKSQKAFRNSKCHEAHEAYEKNLTHQTASKKHK